jgi:hypothetical protein
MVEDGGAGVHHTGNQEPPPYSIVVLPPSSPALVEPYIYTFVLGDQLVCEQEGMNWHIPSWRDSIILDPLPEQHAATVWASSTTQRIDPYKVRFSQSGISYHFRQGKGTIDDLAEALRNGTVKPEDIPPIRLVEKDGLLYTLDNRRLEAFRRAGVDVPYRMATPEEIEEEVKRKFDPDAAETTIRVRGEPER